MIGCTISTIGGLCQGILRASESKLECIQIYTLNSRRWDVQNIGESQSTAIRECAERNNITLTAHVPFLVNLASNDQSLRNKSSARLKQEIINAAMLGINCLVLHPGSYIEGEKAIGITRIVAGLNEVMNYCEEYGVTLLLETMSGQGTQIGRSFEDISAIINQTKNNTALGVCFDTCHVYAAGYDISTLELFELELSKFDKMIGNARIRMFHLNNTKTALGEKRDCHSSIFEGNINLETFEHIVKKFKDAQIPQIIEPASKDNSGPKQVEYLINTLEYKKND
jgi:deoxyribonuclease-4